MKIKNKFKIFGQAFAILLLLAAPFDFTSALVPPPSDGIILAGPDNIGWIGSVTATSDNGSLNDQNNPADQFVRFAGDITGPVYSFSPYSCNDYQFTTRVQGKAYSITMPSNGNAFVASGNFGVQVRDSASNGFYLYSSPPCPGGPGTSNGSASLLNNNPGCDIATKAGCYFQLDTSDPNIFPSGQRYTITFSAIEDPADSIAGPSGNTIVGNSVDFWVTHAGSPPPGSCTIAVNGYINTTNHSSGSATTYTDFQITGPNGYSVISTDMGSGGSTNMFYNVPADPVIPYTLTIIQEHGTHLAGTADVLAPTTFGSPYGSGNIWPATKYSYVNGQYVYCLDGTVQVFYMDYQSNAILNTQ